MSQEVIEIDRKRYDTYNEERLRYRAVDGLTKELVEEISSQKNEPEWMLNFRLKCLDIFQKLPMPNWGPSLENPELMKKYFMKRVPPTLHKFAALHGAVWSGGTFLFVPKGVKVTAPMQAYFRMNAKK